jgi:hypothetical protein
VARGELGEERAAAADDPHRSGAAGRAGAGVHVAVALHAAQGGGLKATASNKTLIASLAKTADSPWDWQELQRRYATGSLDNNGAAQAVDQLIVFLKSKPNPANNGPLPWAEPFIAAVKAGGAISPEQHRRLADAYYGSSPKITANARVSTGKPLHFRMTYGGHWDLPGMTSSTRSRR